MGVYLGAWIMLAPFDGSAQSHLPLLVKVVGAALQISLVAGSSALIEQDAANWQSRSRLFVSTAAFAMLCLAILFV